MKYLRKYNAFKENLEIEETDPEDIKISKEGLNELKAKISEFNSKKSSIDSLYNSDKDITKGLETILGKENRNTFLVSYANIASAKKKIITLQNKGTDKAIELSDFKDRLSETSDNEKRSEINNKISEINSQIIENRKDISDAIRKVPELEKELKEKMRKNEDDMKKWIEKIQ